MGQVSMGVDWYTFHLMNEECALQPQHSTPWVAASSAPCVLPDKNCLPPSSLVYTYPLLSVTCE